MTPQQKRGLLTRGGTASTTMEEHQREVDKIAERVRGFYARKEKFRIYHGETWTLFPRVSMAH
jgi:hypothetical protein